jgi:folate-dependent phosphoribosylglycinamide formyltransferase PurN
MNRIQAILTIHTEQLPDNFQEMIKHEQEHVAKWKEQGILVHFFLRQTSNGAVFIFKDVDEAQVKKMMETLPLYPLMKSIDYFPLIQQY